MDDSHIPTADKPGYQLSMQLNNILKDYATSEELTNERIADIMTAISIITSRFALMMDGLKPGRGTAALCEVHSVAMEAFTEAQEMLGKGRQPYA